MNLHLYCNILRVDLHLCCNLSLIYFFSVLIPAFAVNKASLRQAAVAAFDHVIENVLGLSDDSPLKMSLLADEYASMMDLISCLLMMLLV